jgi:MFS transporter, SHS family, lactate transporter
MDVARYDAGLGSVEPVPRWKWAVTAGVLGWVLDAFDFFVVVFLFDTLAAHFHTSKASVISTVTLTLIMRPFGALAFGALADRYGRKRPLIACVLYFSTVTVLCGLAPTIQIFAILRALYGFGMGGYWGIGASYAMESAPVRLRGILSGVLQGGYPAGYLLAAVAMQVLTPHFGWQSVFFVGFPVACLIAILTALSPESAAWQTQAARSIKEIVSSLTEHKKLFFYLLVLMSVMLCLSHGTQDLYPDFIKSIPELAGKTIAGVGLVYAIPMLYNVAAIIGALTFGHFSERIGRRHASIVALLICLVSMPLWAFGKTAFALAVGACLMQAGTQGAWGVIPAHINELSPPKVRGLFPGFVYQLGVLVVAAVPPLEYLLRNHVGYSWALTSFEVAVIVVLLFLFGFGPEARGRDLSDPELEPRSLSHEFKYE